VNKNASINSLYVHFPFCRHLCNYCDFYKQKRSIGSSFDDFHLSLEKSFNAHDQLMNENNVHWGELDTLYLGGGTPSLWGADGAIYFGSFLEKNNLTLSNNCEFTMEVNPGTWTPETLKKWCEVGVNRFSIGIQSLDKNNIKKLDRVHSLEESYELISYMDKNKFNYSVDFMIGLPSDLNRDISKELNDVLQYSPKHLSVYILTVGKSYVHYSNLPLDRELEREFLEVSTILRERGFEHYEVSNFSLPSFESKHNLKYWSGESVAALGPSATGLICLDTQNDKKLRYKWKTVDPEYVVEILGKDEIRMEEFYLSLRTKFGVSMDFFNSIEKKEVFTGVVNRWIEKGYCDFTDNRVVLRPRAYIIMDTLMDEIFGVSPQLL
jgi:oxygen-independent coproporphyrinogen-3 oxidase